MNRVIARIASDNVLRQLVFGLAGLVTLTAASDPWLRILGGALIAIALTLGGAELFSRRQTRQRTE